MVDLILVLMIAVAVGAAVLYLVKAKKSGAACIGCPSGGTCGQKKNGGCGCGCSGSCQDK